MMRLDIKVIPKSSRNRLCQDGSLLKATVRSAPEKGKANKELIQLLCDHFKVKKAQVRIIKGERSQRKTVEILKK